MHPAKRIYHQHMAPAKVVTNEKRVFLRNQGLLGIALFYAVLVSGAAFYPCIARMGHCP